MDRSHLTGGNSPYQQARLRLRTEFPAPDDLVVVIQSSSAERNRQFVERLAARVRKQPDPFADLFYKGDLATLGPKSLQLVPEKNLRQLRDALRQNRPFIDKLTQVTNLNSLFNLINTEFLSGNTGPNAGVDMLIHSLPSLQNIVVQATQSLSLPGTPPPPGIAGLFGANPDASEAGYITYDRGRLFLLTTRAHTDSLNVKAIESLKQLIRDTEVEMPGLNVGLTGQPVLDYGEMRQSERDSLLASVVSLVLCSLIFIVAYGQVGRPLKAAACLIIGLGFTMGFTTLVIGHLNILSVTFAPMLIGLAIDFGVHFISRYEEETRAGHSVPEAVDKATIFTGQGIVTGAFTTAGAFLAMALTSFRGIREMGVISGGGLLLCLIPMMTLLPILLMHGRQNVLDREHGRGLRRRVRIENLWLERPRLVVGLTLLLCAGAAFEARKVHFDYDLLDLQSKGLPAVVYEQLLIKHASQSVIFASVLADDAAQAREFSEKIQRLPAVASVQSAADFFTEDQSNKLQWARAIQREVSGLHFSPVDRNPVNLDELAATLWYLTGFLGLASERAQPHDPKLAGQLVSLRDSVLRLRRAIHNGQPNNAEQLGKFQQALLGDIRRTFTAIQQQDTSGPLRTEDLPPSLRDRFIGVTGKFLIQVYPRNDIWQHENQRELIEQLRSVVPQDRLDGIPLQLYEYTTRLKDSYQDAAWYALVAIIIMVFLHFRSFSSVVLSLVPVAIGSLWLLGVMGLFGIPFNPANIMTLPLVIGIGVTNGIQILNRFFEDHKPGILAKSTGKAVLVSGLNTIVGFGSLILGRHQGIRSLGIVMSVGIAACMIVGLTLLPTLLFIGWRIGWRVEAGHREPATGAAS